MKPLIILRPEPGATQTLVRAQERGLIAQTHPLFAVSSVAWDVPDPTPYFGLLLTSANAVRCGGPGLARLHYMPVFAVGGTTADAARDAGFGSVVAGEGDVARLLARIATLAPQRLLHLAGADVQNVDVAGITLDRRTVYTAEPLPPSDAFINLLRGTCVIMLHSPRAAACFSQICDKHGVDRSRITISAISANTARAAGTGWQKLAIAVNPRDEALMNVAELLCHD